MQGERVQLCWACERILSGELVLARSFGHTHRRGSPSRMSRNLKSRKWKCQNKSLLDAVDGLDRERRRIHSEAHITGHSEV